MSQEAVEQLLGRLVTDKQFRRLATESLEAASIQAGYHLSPGELWLLSGNLDLQRISELADRLNPGLRRAEGSL